MKVAETINLPAKMQLVPQISTPVDNQAADTLSNYHVTPKNVLQKSPPTNHQQGPTPPFPSLLTSPPALSPPNTLLLPKELQPMRHVQEAGQGALPCGKGPHARSLHCCRRRVTCGLPTHCTRLSLLLSLQEDRKG